jgi:Ca2+-binding EF-hand superfamily protein
MKNNQLKTILTVFSMLLCFSVFAQGPPGGGGQGGRGQQRGGTPDASEILSKLDINKDQVIDKDEAASDERGKISEDFDVIDTNEDGVIDLDELKVSLDDSKPRKISAKKIIKAVDDNGDGTLNELEVAAKKKIELSDNFSKIDTNSDGELDLEELKAFFETDDKPKRRKRD